MKVPTIDEIARWATTANHYDSRVAVERLSTKKFLKFADKHAAFFRASEDCHSPECAWLARGFDKAGLKLWRARR